MVYYMPGHIEALRKPASELTPREIVTELDRFIVGQNRAKRAVAVAMRNRMRRRQLARVFARSSMSAVFDDPETPLAALETRAVRARITAERRAARLDPIGPSPILECVMRLRAERADLRRINWGIAHTEYHGRIV